MIHYFSWRNSKLIFLLLGFIILCNSVKSQRYSSSNFYYFTGIELGKYHINSNTFILDEFQQNIIEKRELNFQQIKLGLGYNYNRSHWFAFGFELDFGFGLSKEHEYNYITEFSSETKSFNAKERMNFASLSYTLDFAIVGDLETTDFTLTISPAFGIQRGWFKSEIDSDAGNSIFENNTNFESNIHRNSEDGVGKEKLFSYFAKIGPTFQYGFSKFGMVYGGVKYAFVGSDSENNRIQRKNWIDLDIGLKFILN